jgi:hypothetical protein
MTNMLLLLPTHTISALPFLSETPLLIKTTTYGYLSFLGRASMARLAWCRSWDVINAKDVGV